MSEKKEYIERGALLKAFGCENAVKYGNKNAEQQHKSYSSMMLYEIADEIYDAPAADVEPVVRCPECVNGQRVNNVWTRCAKDGTRRLDSFYCAHGKERER